MAEADCGFCEALGHRSCDDCGGPAWNGTEPKSQNLFIHEGRELCGYCAESLGLIPL